MKKISALILASFISATIPMSMGMASPQSTESEAQYQTVNLFDAEHESGWKHNTSGSTDTNCVQFKDGEMLLTPRYIVGSTYCNQAMGQGRISFSYQLIDNSPTSTDLDEAEQDFIDFIETQNVFFGVTFLNSPEVRPSSALTVPFNDGAGGYPYMVAFDTEKQGREPDRMKQLGLTVRRYKYEGSHDFTRWSSVNPTEATYLNDAKAPYESKIPDYAIEGGITLDKCFDYKEHTVDIDVKNLYAEKGDEADAVQIEVYFDGVLAIRVIDEMPFESDGYDVEGYTVDGMTDKRLQDGWISLCTYGGTIDSGASSHSYYSLSVKSFTAQFRESNGGTMGGASSGGCNGAIGGLMLLPIGAAAGVAVIVLTKKKKATEGNEEDNK